MIYKVYTTKGDFLIDASSDKKARKKILAQLHKDYFNITKKDILSIKKV